MKRHVEVFHLRRPVLGVALRGARGDAVDEMHRAVAAAKLGDHLSMRRRASRVLVPEVRGEARLGRRFHQGLHVEEADLQLLAVEVDAVDRGALAEQQLDRERAGDAVRAAEDENRHVLGNLCHSRTNQGSLLGEEGDRGRLAVRCQGRRQRAAVEPTERKLLEDLERHDPLYRADECLPSQGAEASVERRSTMCYSRSAEADMPTKHLFHAHLVWAKPPERRRDTSRRVRESSGARSGRGAAVQGRPDEAQSRGTVSRLSRLLSDAHVSRARRSSRRRGPRLRRSSRSDAHDGGPPNAHHGGRAAPPDHDFAGGRREQGSRARRCGSRRMLHRELGSVHGARRAGDRARVVDAATTARRSTARSGRETACATSRCHRRTSR